MSVNYSPGYRDNRCGQFPLFCSRNSGLVYSRIAEYRVFLGCPGKFPEMSCFETFEEASGYYDKMNQSSKYEFVHLVVLVEQDHFYLEDSKGSLLLTSRDTQKRYTCFDKFRYCEWDLGYFEQHQEMPRFSLF